MENAITEKQIDINDVSNISNRKRYFKTRAIKVEKDSVLWSTQTVSHLQKKIHYKRSSHQKKSEIIPPEEIVVIINKHNDELVIDSAVIDGSKKCYQCYF